MDNRRWGDNDRHFGPFTMSLGDSWRLGIVLDSGAGEYLGCHLRLYFFTTTLLIELPGLIRPWRRFVDTSGYEWSNGPGSGYWDEHPREYGFAFSGEGFFQVFLGAQTMDSSTTQNWCCFLPWTQWRHVRHTLYGLDGFHVWAELKGLPWKQLEERRDSCPSMSFEFSDFDGERIIATTRIEEREWLFGVGWFKWLSWFRRPKVIRSLDIRFSSEVGKRKGSWKGGTIGHAIDLLPGELHESAFRRYCADHNMTFVGNIHRDVAAAEPSRKKWSIGD